MSETTLEECKAGCVANVACKSLDWKPQEDACSLNGVTDSEVALDDFPNYSYIEMRCDGELYWGLITVLSLKE